MCIIGNQKAQEAKNEVIQNHKQFTVTCPSRSRLCIFTTKHPFLCNEDLQLCVMLFHTSWIFIISKSQNHEHLITKNTLYQLNLEGKKCHPAFLGDKNFRKEKNGNRLLDKDIGQVMSKILHSFNVQLKMRHKATEHTKYSASKRIHYPI